MLVSDISPTWTKVSTQLHISCKKVKVYCNVKHTWYNNSTKLLTRKKKKKVTDAKTVHRHSHLQEFYGFWNWNLKQLQTRNVPHWTVIPTANKVHHEQSYISRKEWMYLQITVPVVCTETWLSQLQFLYLLNRRQNNSTNKHKTCIQISCGTKCSLPLSLAWSNIVFSLWISDVSWSMTVHALMRVLRLHSKLTTTHI
jgi:glycerophosphoryl diester phosphodiesterase